jgi:RNAse (barnase) inhibitor barstar
MAVMIGPEHFASLAPPWVVLSTCDANSLRGAILGTSPSLAFITVRGQCCDTKSKLFDEFARALKFPEYFGHNWDAFDECINDLEWLDTAGYVVAVTQAERLLVSQDADYATLIDILSDAGREWAAPSDQRSARPFHAALLVSSPEDLRRREWRLAHASFDRAPR